MTQTGGGVRISFEFFPPKTAKMEAKLWEAITQLEGFQPAFVSVTYGAGGSTRERTHTTVTRILHETSLTPAAHLTCVASPRADVDDILRTYWNEGVRHIVALRGDMPEGPGTPYAPHPEGYINAADLVAGIKSIADFEVSVAAYPEKHPESPDFDTDLDMLAAKVEAGAARAITQFFFDTDVFLRYCDMVAARGLSVPIVPGLIPVLNFKQMAGFAARCGASVPAWLAERFAGLEDDAAACADVAADVMVDQVEALRAQGIGQFHFYTLNRANIVSAVCERLGLGEPV